MYCGEPTGSCGENSFPVMVYTDVSTVPEVFNPTLWACPRGHLHTTTGYISRINCHWPHYCLSQAWILSKSWNSGVFCKESQWIDGYKEKCWWRAATVGGCSLPHYRWFTHTTRSSHTHKLVAHRYTKLGCTC